MFFTKHFFTLISLTVLAPALAAPSVPQAHDYELTGPDTPIANVSARGLFPLQCNGTKETIDSVELTASIITETINKAITVIDEARVKKEPFSPQILEILRHIHEHTVDLGEDLGKLRWLCVTFRMIPGFANTMVTLLADTSRLLLHILTYIIFTGKPLTKDVWDAIFGTPKALVLSVDKLSENAGFFGVIFSGFVGQLKEMVNSLCGHCPTCTNPFN